MEPFFVTLNLPVVQSVALAPDVHVAPIESTLFVVEPMRILFDEPSVSLRRELVVMSQPPIFPLVAVIFPEISTPVAYILPRAVTLNGAVVQSVALVVELYVAPIARTVDVGPEGH